MSKVALVVQQLNSDLNTNAAKCLVEFLRVDYRSDSDVVVVGYMYGTTTEQPKCAPENVSLVKYESAIIVEQMYGPYYSTFRVYNAAGEYHEFVLNWVAPV